MTSTITFSGGAEVTFELYPEIAPNTVNRYAYFADIGLYNGHSIERIVKNELIDMSFSAFHDSRARKFIANETESGTYLPDEGFCVGMGGYPDGDRINIAAAEFFITLCPTPRITGKYPIFGRITAGFDILKEIASSPLKNSGYMDILCPSFPVIIEKISIDGDTSCLSAPVFKPGISFPENWMR